MRIHYLQHIPIEGPGSIEKWALKKNHSLSATRLYNNETLPESDDFDWLVIMGGPMSVNDENDHPWLKEEKEFIKNAIDSGKTLIGICLGAQLIAASLNAGVQKNKFTEIGWFPVTLTPAAKKSKVFGTLPDTIDAFHWHGETFDLPKGAIGMAKSQACANQAFSIGDKIFGFQFHLETSEKGAMDFITHFADEIKEAPYIQSAETMLTDASRFDSMNKLMETILNNIEIAGTN